MNNEKVVAIIPARGGSKGLPRKNIYPVNGTPLIAYTIAAGLRCPAVTTTVVSSDSQEILEVAKKYGAEVIDRPAEYATDTATSESAITHAIKALHEQGQNFDVLCLLQVTSPLRTADDLTKALEKYYNSRATSLISVYEPAHSPYKAFKLNGQGFLEGLVDNRTPFMRRQDLPPAYMPNGAIYIINVDEFTRTGSLWSDMTIPFVMDESKSIDIDTIDDIRRLEKKVSAID